MSENVSIFYIPDGKEWAEYLQVKFNEKEYDISVILRDFRESPNFTDTKLNILLVTPDLIELDKFEIKSHFDSATSVAVLAGVDHDDWEFAAKILNLESGLDWFIYELQREEESVRGLLMFIVSLYESIGRQSPRMSWSDRDSISSGTDDEFIRATLERSISKATNDDESRDSKTSIYSDLPCNKPVHTVSYVFRKGDQAYILLEGTHFGRVSVKFHERENVVEATRVSEKATLYSLPHNRVEQEKFAVMLDDIEIGHGEIEKLSKSSLDACDEGEAVSPDKEPYSVRSSSSSGVSSRLSVSPSENIYDVPHFHPDGLTYMNVSRTPSEISTASNVYCNKHDSLREDSKLDQLNRLLHSITDPIGILCQSLGMDNDINRLDDKLATMVQPADVLKHLPNRPFISSSQDSSDSEWPSLLHFGAHYNLTTLCCSLVNNPTICVACVQKNKNGLVPHDIAKSRGHFQLAEDLKQAFQVAMSNMSDLPPPKSCSGRTPPPVQPKPSPSAHPRTPPSVQPRKLSSRSQSSEDEGTPKSQKKSILKRPSQESLKSEEESFYFREGSISSMDSLRVTFGSQAISDDERTPVPSTGDPFDNYHEHIQGTHNHRQSDDSLSTHSLDIPGRADESGGIEIPKAHRKDLDEFLGRNQLSSSVPNVSNLQQPKKSHWPFRKRDSGKSNLKAQESFDDSDLRHSSKHGGKVKVYKHKKEHHEERDSSPEAQEEFRGRLGTFPLLGQKLKRPDMKTLKQKQLESKHAAAGLKAASHHVNESPSHDTKVHKREKKHLDNDSKDHHKSKVEWMIKHAMRRKSTRLSHAQNDQHTHAPAMPQMKSMGKF